MRPYQTRRQSLEEAIVNILVGYSLQVVAAYYFLPWFNLHPSITESALIGGIMTVLSIIRSYGIRRFYEWRLS